MSCKRVRGSHSYHEEVAMTAELFHEAVAEVFTTYSLSYSFSRPETRERMTLPLELYRIIYPRA